MTRAQLHRLYPGAAPGADGRRAGTWITTLVALVREHFVPAGSGETASCAAQGYRAAAPG